MPENGHYVTRGEFNVVYDIVVETRNDVKTLLATQARNEGSQSARRDISKKRAVLYGALVTILVSALGAAGSIVASLIGG